MSGDPRPYGAGGGSAGGEAAADGHRGDVAQERERLIDAFTKLAAEQGFPKATARKVAAEAGVSLSAFYDHFTDERQCLSAAYDAFVDRIVAGAEHAMDSDEEWPQRVKHAVAAGLAFVSEAASRSRFFAVDALAIGPAVLDRYIAATERIGALLRSGREEFPRAADLPPMTERVLIGGIANLVGRALLAEEHEQIIELQAELLEILLNPYLGREQAKRVAAA